jgi:hypothetical protein
MKTRSGFAVLFIVLELIVAISVGMNEWSCMSSTNTDLCGLSMLVFGLPGSMVAMGITQLLMIPFAVLHTTSFENILFILMYVLTFAVNLLLAYWFGRGVTRVLNSSKLSETTQDTLKVVLATIIVILFFVLLLAFS